MGIIDLAARSLDVLFPPACAACGLPGDGICAACRGVLVTPAAPGCARCGHPWEIHTDRCAECPAAVDLMRQAVVWDPVAQAVVAALKDEGRREMAEWIARIVAEHVPRPPRAVVLVPVPLARSRLEERGFNQAGLIARALGERWELPTADLLERVRDGPPQRGSSISERRIQVRGAFRAAGPIRSPSACVVDDVVTTGATISACARELRRAGVAAVGAVAFARVVAHPRR